MHIIEPEMTDEKDSQLTNKLKQKNKKRNNVVRKEQREK